MKTTTKIGIMLGSSGLALIALYFLVPLKQWKKYKENHPSLFEVEDETTPKYTEFCKSYWTTFNKVGTEKEEEINYDGGELPEVVVTPSGTTTTTKRTITPKRTSCNKPVTA